MDGFPFPMYVQYRMNGIRINVCHLQCAVLLYGRFTWADVGGSRVGCWRVLYTSNYHNQLCMHVMYV